MQNVTEMFTYLCLSDFVHIRVNKEVRLSDRYSVFAFWRFHIDLVRYNINCDPGLLKFAISC